MIPEPGEVPMDGASMGMDFLSIMLSVQLWNKVGLLHKQYTIETGTQDHLDSRPCGVHTGIHMAYDTICALDNF